MDAKKEYLEWLSSRDTGTSSKTMLNAITGIPTGECDIPYDISDVGRCVRLLRRFPELREKIHLVSEKHKEWMPFVDCWKELERRYDECISFESLVEEEKKKLKRRKHFQSPNQTTWNLMCSLVMISRYLKGMRMQNGQHSWSNRPPEKF